MPRPDGKNWDGIRYHDPAVGKGVVYAFKSRPVADTITIKPRGVDPVRRCRVSFADGTTDTAYLGADLSLSGDKTWNALKIDGSPTIDLNGKTLTIGNSTLNMMVVKTGAGYLGWLSSGGFAASGADATFQPNITWNASGHIPNGAALLLNSTTADSKIYLGLADGTSKLNLGTDAAKMYLREIEVAYNPNSTTDMAGIR